MSTKAIGDKGEAFAVRLYEKLGFKTVARNYHS